MVSLFRAATFEDWTDLMYIQMYSCVNMVTATTRSCAQTLQNPLTAVFYFISFIIISGLVILNLVIGVIIQSMTQAKSSLEKDEARKLLRILILS